MFEENEKKGKYNEDDAAYLISVVDNIEADRLTAALGDAHIPVLRKYDGLGSYMTVIMGDSVFGVDLYVPKELYDRAKEIIEAVNGNIVSEIDENSVNADNMTEDETENKEEMTNNRLVCKTIFGVYFLSDIIFYGIMAVIIIGVLIITLIKMI